MKHLIDRLARDRVLDRGGFVALIEGGTPETAAYLFEKARAAREPYYGHSIYIRGLIEFTNYCKNDCYYCGIRRSSPDAVRYRLSKEDVIACCRAGWGLGFRSFVLQGGEDGIYSPEDIAGIVRGIKQCLPGCAVTLSFGEHPRASYQLWRDAGADRYLLRHETADPAHYRLLHPPALRLENRIRCLRDLKEIGYQVGTGFMVGSPYQSPGSLAEDLLLIHALQPHMVGIGPFIPHHGTPFADQPAGSVALTLYLIGILRLMLPAALLPATTALGTLDPEGREKGILAGANVIMPNLSPVDVREKYLLYDGKACTGDEAAESLASLEERVRSIGYQIADSRGDSLMDPPHNEAFERGTAQ